MVSTPEELQELVRMLDSALDNVDGYVAVQWALRKRGYFVTPSYRRSAAEWYRYLLEVFPGGQVLLYGNSDDRHAQPWKITEVAREDGRMLLRLVNGHGPEGFRFDITDAEHFGGELRNVANAHGEHHGSFLRRSVPGVHY